MRTQVNSILFDQLVHLNQEVIDEALYERLNHEINESGLLWSFIKKSPYRDMIFGSWLASTPKGLSVISAHDHRLASYIKPKSLNHVLTKGKYKGWSLAFALANTDEGVAILSARNYRLASLITSETLNHIITLASTEDCSVAAKLASTAQGRELLGAHHNQLLSLIEETTLESYWKGKNLRSYIASYFPVPELDEAQNIFQEDEAIDDLLKPELNNTLFRPEVVMSIAAKYMTVSKLPSYLHEMPDGLPQKCISNNISRTISMVQLSTGACILGKNETPEPLSFCGERFIFYGAPEKNKIQPNDRCFFVMAGRKN